MFAARFLCFGSFPAFSLQVGTNERMKVAFEDGTAETTTRCGPARRHFHIKFDHKKAVFNRKNNDMLYANPLWAWKYNENISKTKGRYQVSFACHCLEKIENKGQRAIKTKECERQNETKWRARQQVNAKDNKRMWA